MPIHVEHYVPDTRVCFSDSSGKHEYTYVWCQSNPGWWLYVFLYRFSLFYQEMKNLFSKSVLDNLSPWTVISNKTGTFNTGKRTGFHGTEDVRSNLQIDLIWIHCPHNLNPKGYFNIVRKKISKHYNQWFTYQSAFSFITHGSYCAVRVPTLKILWSFSVQLSSLSADISKNYAKVPPVQKHLLLFPQPHHQCG